MNTQQEYKWEPLTKHYSEKKVNAHALHKGTQRNDGAEKKGITYFTKWQEEEEEYSMGINNIRLLLFYSIFRLSIALL